MRTSRNLAVASAVALLAALPAAALAHPERATQFPDPSYGAVPAVKTSGPARVVCKADSAARIRRIFGVPAGGRAPAFTGSARTSATARVRRQGRERLALLSQCRYHDIQAAVNVARSGDRILILPGLYKELPSRRVPYTGTSDDRQSPNESSSNNSGIDIPGAGALDLLGGLRPVLAAAGVAASGECRSTDDFERPNDGDKAVPNYQFQYRCRNSRNLIAIVGDSNGDRRCDVKCNLQLEGMGRRPTDVLIVGDRIKRDVIRADRADGIVIRNLAAEQGAFNNIDVVETNGFRLDRIVTRYAQNYGALTFTSDHGLYQYIDAYRNGDSGVYPGSGPEGHCARYGIEIRNVDSHDNVLGYSGTAGNGTYTHDSKFHDNSTGATTDSFASGHPGMPQDCSKWVNNEFSSNNTNYFTKKIQDACARTRFEDRPRTMVCPQFQVPVGTGIGLYGANSNLISGNHIWNNWRSGTRLFYVPAAVRGDSNPADQFDTSNLNRQEGNFMGVTPRGARDPNGVDFFWDEEGMGNCWTKNTGPNGAAPTSDPPPPLLPDCPGSPVTLPPNARKSAMEVPCATWDPAKNQFPPGCTWFDTPPEPK